VEQIFGSRFFGDISIRQRLAAGFAVLILLLMLMTGVGAWRLAELNGVTTRMANVNMRIERLVGAWFAETKSNAVRAVALTQSDDAELKRILAPQLEATTRRISELQKEVERTLDSPKAKALFEEVGSKRKNYLDIRKTVLDKKKAGQTEEALALLNTSMLPAVDAYVGSIGALVEHYTSEAMKDAAAAAATAESGRNLLVGVSVAGVLLGILFSWWITSSITAPMREAVSIARRVADGDLTMKVHAGDRSETGQLLQALADMTENLRSLAAEVSAGARTVSDTSAQIAQGNIDLSQRTEEQASTLEETASSMEELTSTVSQNAQNAREASELAVGASEVARKGGQAVGQVVTTMTGISESSHKIADIIGVIDAIAFQTNILALNAAVEAARAGEQGRGFAVVATEVRNLAQRSAAAAKEIKTLIGDSADKVEAGARLVDAAGKTMEEIVGSVKKVSDLMAEIAAASQEQSMGIEQVNTAVTQMEQVVQQNASLAEEATAATESMKGQAATLLQTVSRFKLDGEHSEAAVPQPAAPAPAVPGRGVPAPAKARARARLASGYATALGAPQLRASTGSRDWKEFQATNG
jgi:methyl-accepting chemotaxis protein